MIAGLVEKLEAATMPAREEEVVVAESRRDTCRQIMRCWRSWRGSIRRTCMSSGGK
jgi:hypothetical protein